MTHSPVYFDGYSHVTMVAHVEGVNDLIDPEDDGYISGLLEYSLYPGEGVLRVYDMDDDVTYEVHTVEDWEGLDKGAIQALLDAVDGKDDVLEIDEGYSRAWNTYQRTGDPEGALANHKIGTIVRIEVGAEGYALVKVGENAWEISGDSGVWTDAEVEGDDYEVIYSAGENDE